MKKRMPLKPWERRRVDVAALYERITREEIELLSNFRLDREGVGVEVGYIEGADLPSETEELDYSVEFNRQTIAWIDVTRSNYTFERSQIMPVYYYKGQLIEKLNAPVFIVFRMSDGLVMWIRGEDVTKCEHHTEEMGGKPNTITTRTKVTGTLGFKTLSMNC